MKGRKLYHKKTDVTIFSEIYLKLEDTPFVAVGVGTCAVQRHSAGVPAGLPAGGRSAGTPPQLPGRQRRL